MRQGDSFYAYLLYDKYTDELVGKTVHGSIAYHSTNTSPEYGCNKFLS